MKPENSEQPAADKSRALNEARKTYARSQHNHDETIVALMVIVATAILMGCFVAWWLR